MESNKECKCIEIARSSECRDHLSSVEISGERWCKSQSSLTSLLQFQYQAIYDFYIKNGMYRHTEIDVSHMPRAVYVSQSARHTRPASLICWSEPRILQATSR